MATSAWADVYPAATAGDVSQTFAGNACWIYNSVPDATAINMEYLLSVVDMCNTGMDAVGNPISITSYGTSPYATKHMANLHAVELAANMVYTAISGVSLLFGAEMTAGWTFDGQEVLPDGIYFAPGFGLAMSPFWIEWAEGDLIVEVRFALLDSTSVFSYGLSPDARCNFNVHINDYARVDENTVARVIETGMAGQHLLFKYSPDTQSHTISTVYSADGRIHRLFFDGEELSPDMTIWDDDLFLDDNWAPGMPVCNAFGPGNFVMGCDLNDPNAKCDSRVMVYSVRIYSIDIGPLAICNNAWADYLRFGGAKPRCPYIGI
ncbi:MAG: hypothetical protein K2L94_05215 [Alphaproteobacteria bacterium]|nr:hypothetical protein [Alphaproteobacteria bacterium]